MIPLDRFEKWSARLDEAARQYLDGQDYQRFLAIPPPERLRQLQAILEKPIAQFSPVNEAFFRARWGEVLDAAAFISLSTSHQLDAAASISLSTSQQQYAALVGEGLLLVEVATGDSDVIPQMLARRRPGSRFVALNMNRRLTAGLRANVQGLPLRVEVIEDDARAIARYLPPASVDLIAFQHGVNDVVQSILCAQQGVDTIHSDWMETLPEMIRILQCEIAQNTLEQHAGPAFIGLLEQLARILKEGGLLAMNHYMYQLDLDWGYPPELWENFIPIARGWIQRLAGCEEVRFAGFDPHWWMFFRKK